MPDYSKHWWYIERPFPWPMWLVVGIILTALIIGSVAAC